MRQLSWLAVACTCIVGAGTIGAKADVIAPYHHPSCARTTPNAARPSGLSAASRELVPKPFDSMRVCRYGATSLLRSVELRSSEADRLAGLLNALRRLTFRQLHTFTSCFYAEPQPVVVDVVYPSGRTLSVFVPIGCGIGVFNGLILRVDPEAVRVRLYDELERATGARSYHSP